MPSKEAQVKSAISVVVMIIAVMFCATRAHAAQNPQLSVNDPIILSDTHGYNFEKYLDQLAQQVRMKWYSDMPDSARQGQKGRVVVIFTVLREGTVQDLRIVSGSGTESLDQAAATAVQSASPFPQLPADFNDNRIVVQFTFMYNQR
jgi:TonB family protein